MSDDVHTWLRALGLEQYSEAFASNDINLRVLPYLTEADLRELGLSLGHRKIVMAGVEASLKTAASPLAGIVSTGAKYRPVPRITSSERAPERRLLTVLFCDLTGSTELSRLLDPEDLREVLGGYQQRVAETVIRYGGYVARYMGDGILTYFGWPCAYEDQAERAVRAGLEALASVQVLKSKDTELRARVGIATGQVVVGDLFAGSVREEGAVAGETPNLAARLQTIAKPNQLVIAQSTKLLLSDAFDIEDLGDIPLKGFGTGTRAYLVRSQREVESRFHAAHAAVLSPFVGRAQELEILLERWDLARASKGQAVLISGEAGIGKSRLVEAFTERIGSTPHAIVRLQCSPYSSNSALAPIVQHLSRTAAFQPEDRTDQRLDKLENMLADLGIDTSRVGSIYAELLSLDYHNRYDDLELAPRQRKTLILETLVEQFLHRAKRVTLLLIVEDAHWIDPTTTELLEGLLAAIKQKSVMLLVTHRASWQTEWPRVYGHVLPVSIGPLAQPLVADMVRNIVGRNAPDSLVNAIVGRTDGIPLFVEEVARFLVERDAGEHEIKMVLPATLQGSLLARLDRCEPTAKEVAQIASVIGREFRQDLLSRVCRLPSTDLDSAVAELMAAHLLLRAGSSEDTFVFRHALIQDATYQSLLISKRQQYHAEIARALAEHREISETQPELIARHFSETAVPELALPFWRRAGDRAIGRSANYEAIDHYEKVLAIAQKLPDSQDRENIILDTKIALGWAQTAAGDLQQASATFADSARAARAAGNADALANCAIGFAQAHFYSHDQLDSSINLLLEALPAAEASDSRQRCQILSALGRAFYMNGDLERADQSNSKAIEIARRIGDDRTLCEALFNPLLIPAALSGAQSQNLLKRLGELLGIAERLNDADFRTRALATRIYYSAEFGDREGMIGALDTFCSLTEGQQMTHQQWVGQHGHAMLALLSGDFAAAEEFAEKAYELGRRRYGENVEGVYGMQMFTIRREQGRLSEIAPIFRHFIDSGNLRTWKPGFAVIAAELGFKPQAQKLLDELRETGFALPMDAVRSTTLSYLADVCAALDDAVSAHALYALLVPYRHMTVTAGVVTVCYGSAGRFLGELAEVLTDWDRAEQHFEEAIEMDRNMQAYPWLAHTQHRFARMLRRRSRRGDLERAEVLLNESWTTACRLKMTALMDRIREQRH
jgi:predicted ATPase/class 3 adenylate cyclase